MFTTFPPPSCPQMSRKPRLEIRIPGRGLREPPLVCGGLWKEPTVYCEQFEGTAIEVDLRGDWLAPQQHPLRQLGRRLLAATTGFCRSATRPKHLWYFPCADKGFYRLHASVDPATISAYDRRSCLRAFISCATLTFDLHLTAQPTPVSAANTGSYTTWNHYFLSVIIETRRER